jgi:hypothetical protein
VNKFQPIFEKQKNYFNTDATKSYEWRMEQLDRIANLGHRETHADREFARELWNLSETVTGIYFQTEDFALFCCAL